MKIKKILIVVIALLVTLSITKVSASVGYTYSHDNKPIYSSAGFTVTNEGIFNVNSEAWKGQIAASDFGAPTDLFYYNDNGEEIIYVVDSGSNKLFIFDGNMNYIETHSKFEIDPSKFTNAELDEVQTISNSSTVAITNKDGFYDKLVEIRKIPFELRTEEQRVYVEPFNLSGVYRSLRPLRNDDGTIVEGQYQDVIYLCDTGNNQVLILDSKTYEIIQVVVESDDATFAEKPFKPTKLATDSTGRMYIISEGFYEGIMLMSYKGDFMRFIGVTYLTLTFWESLKINLATETQRSQMQDYLNANFKNLTIDKDGFIYTVSYAATDPKTGAVKDDKTMIKRINQAGNDVLKRFGYSVPKGDLVTIKTGSSKDIGSSNFEAIAVNEYGSYTVADSRNGRLFTYDHEGNLLYISGGKGTEVSNLANPVAVRYQGEKLLVLDKNNKTVLRFEPTETAQLINNAVKAHYSGDVQTASGYWKNVISDNPNYELAYVGVGKTLLEEQRYEEAMYYFEKGYDVEYYSKAYKAYRDQKLKEYLPFVLYAIVIGVAVWGGFKIYGMVKKGFKSKEEGEF